MKNIDIQKKYLKRAKIVAYLLQLAPFVRMVGLNGSLTRWQARESSDIDFLIIAKRNRIWTCRIFVTLITHLTGLRRYGDKTAGRICLNRYQTDNFLDIQPHNDYHARTFSQTWPLVNVNKTYEKFIQKNVWMAKMGYSFKKNEKNLQKNVIFASIRKMKEWILNGSFGDAVEKTLGNYQKKRILSDIRTRKAPKGRVRVSDRELCFHPLKEV
ncbi:hypothetical protein A2V71_02110 [Candidatus Berkelbacteria bacterium RBG_13_40_8]|uniref:Polymerase nucleotidyl transferase domain-containing protein n=1 Tax=Candidatus Berkelbacteria bacterium RBG_13_40_8 TaxID=1797467 RepID=A0A1F5DQ99_9BACT|nr:MAG: hypothetical protein A2V71_02110 [Candidatus Berkelbacteria bacterium RBG_13_40_8]